MTAATLILIAPCSLLLGALLQLLVARLCSARTKGILAFLSCVPAILAVIGIIGSVRSGQAVDLTLFQWDGPLALVLHVDALSVLFALMGTCIGGFVLLYSIGYMAHDKSATRFYCHHAGLHRRLHRPRLQRQPLHLLSLLGTRRPLLLQPGRLLVHQPGSRSTAPARFC